MATAPPATVVTDRPSVHSPLARLSGAIRRYVLLEGAAAIGLFLALWFWLGLAADFGSFKLFGFDWVQELPRSFRGVFLVGLLAGLVAVVIFKLVRRLTVDFAPAALALVLEKKFPAILGDRLITAVELADVDRAEAQGYSREMIEETVREAGERVAQVPVNDVFDWSRLKRMGAWVIGLMFIPFLVFGMAYSAVNRTNPFSDFLPRFGDVSGTWIKRNLLLQNVIWPRKAMLTVLDFPASGELRVGRDAPAPRLRIRAHRWVIADSRTREGWRPMTWDDLTPALIGRSVPALPIELLESSAPSRRAAVVQAAGLIAAPGLIPTPAAPVQPMASEPWTLDRVEIALEDAGIRQRLLENAKPAFDELTAMFDEMTARTAGPVARRNYRRLEVPDHVQVKYWGSQTENGDNWIRGPGWEYSGTLSDLKESVKFWARGADYYTATRAVTLVPPPALQQLQRIEYRPAYLYHRAPIGEPLGLKGLRQKVTDLVSLNGPTSRFTLPAGTTLILEGTVDKELTEAVLRPRGRSSESSLKQTTLELLPDHLGFRHRFENVTTTLEFELEFTDTDDVRSTRHVVVEPLRDLPPMVNVVIDGIRKTAPGPYMVTPVAQIPFDGKIADGVGGQLGGLDKIEYSLTLTRLESASIVNTQAGWLMGAITPLIGGRFDSLLLHSASTAEVSRLINALAPEARPKSFPLETFVQQLRERATRDVTKADFLALLEHDPGPSPLIKDFVVQPKFEFLDLRDRLPELKVQDELAVQPRYRMKLTVTATDNNIETGPGVAENKEPPFTILVVSEPELLVEIAREEEVLHLKTEDAVSRLREARQKLEKTAEELPLAAVDQLATFAQRSQEVLDATEKARDVVQEVFNEYSRILRELELNRVQAKLIEKVKGEICMPLESALKGEFVQAEEGLESFRKELEASRKPSDVLTQQAKARLDKLIDKLSQIMAAMGEVTTINKLIAALREIEKGQDQGVGARLKELQKLQREKLIRDLEKVKGLEGDEKK